MLDKFTNWLLELVEKIFSTLWDFVIDAAVAVFEGIVAGFVALISTIPVPQWMQGGLASIWSGMDSGILFFLSQMGVPQALTIVGGGYLFRLGRKIATLFQW